MHNGKNIDKRILEGCLRRQPKSQRALVDKYAGYLLGICKRYLNDDENAKDLVQDSLVKIFKNLEKFDENKGNFKSWITTISIRLCLSKLKEKKMTIVHMDEDLDTDVTTANTSQLDSLDSAYLINMIKELPDGYREVFNMYAIDGYSHAEIADYLNITSDVSRARLVRARKKLMIKIKDLNKEELWANTI